MCNCTSSCNCNTSGCNPCEQPKPICIQTVTCNPCTYTMNTDCVFYKGNRLSFEATSVVNGSARSVSSLLETLSTTRQKYPSKIVTFNNNTGPSSYSVTASDLGKTILLYATDDGTAGVLTFTISLPTTPEFADEELVFKNISTPSNSGLIDYQYNFSVNIQTNFDPFTNSTLWTSLATNDTLRLRFVADPFGVYRWFRV